MPAKTTAQNEITTDQCAGEKNTRQCKFTRNNTDKMHWNIPRTKKHGEFPNHQSGSDQTDSNHLRGNGQVLRPLSA